MEWELTSHLLFFPPLSFFSLACDEKNELPPGTVGLTASTCSRLNWNAKGRTCRGLPKGNSPEPPQCCLFSLCLSPGHAIFKLTYLSNHDYKHLYFESDAATVNEIVLKVSAPPRARPQSLGPGPRVSGWQQPPPPGTGQGSRARFAEQELPSGHPGGEHPYPGPHHRSAALLPIQPNQDPLQLPPIHCRELLKAPGMDSEEIVVIG